MSSRPSRHFTILVEIHHIDLDTQPLRKLSCEHASQMQESAARLLCRLERLEHG